MGHAARPEIALRRIVADLNALSRRFALVGGLAVSARTEPRLTRDADLVVTVEGDPDAEALIRALQAREWRVLAAVEQEAARRLAAVRLGPAGEPPQGAVIDLLFAASGIEPEVLARDDRTRPRDRVDLAALAMRWTPAWLSSDRSSGATVESGGGAR